MTASVAPVPVDAAPAPRTGPAGGGPGRRRGGALAALYLDSTNPAVRAQAIQLLQNSLQLSASPFSRSS